MTTDRSMRGKPADVKYIVLKFASVGVVATGVHAAVYFLCVGVSNIQPQAANLAAYLVALVVSYIGQRGWTFSHITPGSQSGTKTKFVISSLLGYALNATWVAVVTDILQVSPLYALPGIVLLTPLITFLLLKYWVFTGE